MDFLRKKLAEVEGEMVTTSGEAAAGGGTSSLAAPSWLTQAASSVAAEAKKIGSGAAFEELAVREELEHNLH